MQNLIFTLNVVAPVFLIIFLGYFLKKRGIINDNFTTVGSKIVFTVTLPALIFSKISTTHYSEVLNLKQIIFVNFGIVCAFAFAWGVSHFICDNGRDQGAFIQGSFRSNIAILSFALIFNAFGQTALANAAMLLAFVMPLYNILAVIALTVPQHKEKQINAWKTLKNILRNPLILTVLVSLPFTFYQITLHSIIVKTIDYLASMTLPLALLGIGGSLSFTSIKKEFRLPLLAASIKIIVMPLSLVYLAYLMNFRGTELGVLFFFFGAPAAVASYIMAEAMGSNGKLAGNIILLSTLGSVITLTLGLFLLKSLGLV